MSLYALSGIDGCGKSLQIRMLENWLSGIGYSVFVSKAYSEAMKVLLSPCWDQLSNPTATMFLFQALHAQQYADVTEALEQGKIVLADRWDESYLAYHENFGELSIDPALRFTLNRTAFHDHLPDIGFLFVVPPDVARRRRQLRGRMERFEDRSDSYYETIQSAYVRIAQERRWHLIEATDTPESIHERIQEILAPCLRQMIHGGKL